MSFDGVSTKAAIPQSNPLSVASNAITSSSTSSTATTISSNTQTAHPQPEAKRRKRNSSTPQQSISTKEEFEMPNKPKDHASLRKNLETIADAITVHYADSEIGTVVREVMENTRIEIKQIPVEVYQADKKKATSNLRNVHTVFFDQSATSQQKAFARSQLKKRADEIVENKKRKEQRAAESKAKREAKAREEKEMKKASGVATQSNEVETMDVADDEDESFDE
jgi:hypothetical protein